MIVFRVLRAWDSRIATFLNADRLWGWNVVLAVALALCCLGYIGLSSTGFDPMGNPVGTDFTSFYAASKLAIAGHPEAAYDPTIHGATQNAIFQRKLSSYSAFFYPPIFLLYCLPFALMPYFLSLALWQSITFVGYWRVTRRFGRPEIETLAVAAFPAVLINLGHGQNAFLSATLFGAAILALNTRPIVAGLLFGCLAYKPQLGIAIPFALMAAQRWKTFFAAAGTVVALAVVATTVFGIHIWQAFLANTPLAGAVLEYGLVEPYKMQSMYAAVRVFGGSHLMASAAQGLVTLGVLSVLIWLNAKTPRREIEAPLMVLAALLATPFVLDYDLVLLALPLAWLFGEARRTGFLPYEKIAMLAAYILPLYSRTIADYLGLPLGPLVIAWLFAIVARRLLIEIKSGDYPARLEESRHLERGRLCSTPP